MNKHKKSFYWSLGGMAPLGVLGLQFSDGLGVALCGVQLFCLAVSVYYGFIKK